MARRQRKGAVQRGGGSSPGRFLVVAAILLVLVGGAVLWFVGGESGPVQRLAEVKHMILGGPAVETAPTESSVPAETSTPTEETAAIEDPVGSQDSVAVGGTVAIGDGVEIGDAVTIGDGAAVDEPAGDEPVVETTEPAVPPKALPAPETDTADATEETPQVATASVPGEEDLGQVERPTMATSEEPGLAAAREALEAGDVERALARLEPLAAEGFAGAQTLLGLIYATGEGVEADLARSLALLTEAAEQGHAEAQFNLAKAHLYGSGAEVDRVLALAWFMQAAARGHEQATAERDRGLRELDGTGRQQAASKARSFDVPMPAGWISDPENGVAVWSPSWYRNGTYQIRIEAEAVEGLAQGPAKVTVIASLSGYSGHTYEGVFTGGLMLAEGLSVSEPVLLASDEVRIELALDENSDPRIRGVWQQIPLEGLEIPACPSKRPRLGNETRYFAVMDPSFAGLEDAAVQTVAEAVVALAAARCPLQANVQVDLVLLPPTHRAVFDRGDMTYQPSLAEIQLYGIDQPVENWSVKIKNHAREAHEAREREAEKQREKAEREQKKAREIAAALARELPDIRGLKLGMSLAEVRESLGAEAAAWEPPWDLGREMPAFGAFEQVITLADQSQITAVFTSRQNGSRLQVLVYEQTLREGPKVDDLRAQLYAKYGEPDDEAGQRSWLTWWLKSSVEEEPKGAFLKGRIQTDGSGERVAYLRLTLNDHRLGRLDEEQRAAARRKSEQEAYERSKSDEVKF